MKTWMNLKVSRDVNIASHVQYISQKLTRWIPLKACDKTTTHNRLWQHIQGDIDACADGGTNRCARAPHKVIDEAPGDS